MKNFFLFPFLLLLIVSCSENPNDVANVEATDYFPLTKGSHWTYSVTDFDSLGNPMNLADSEYVRVEDCNFIGGKNVYVLSISTPQFIQGKNESITDYANVGINGSDLQLFCKALYPYVPLDTSECMSKMPERWIDFARFSSNQWSLRDSFVGDKYPSLVPKADSVTHDTTYAVEESQTAWIYTLNAKRENDEQISINGKTYNTVVHSFSGDRVLRLVKPDNVQLTIDPEIADKYSADYKSVIVNEFTLKLWYARGIGIVKSEGKLMRGHKQIYNRRKELGSYFIKN